jgi:hypothetical protein
MGRAAAEAEAEIGDGEDAGGECEANDMLNGLTDDSQEMISRRARLIFFRDGQITDETLSEHITKGLAAISYKFAYRKAYAARRSINLQTRMFCSKKIQKLV